MREDGGHFEYLQARTASLLENARKQGMSEAAMARLPKPVVQRAKPLPPVVLAAASEGNPVAQANMLAYRARTARPKKKKPPKDIGCLGAGRIEVTPADRALYRQIVDIAAAQSGVSADALVDFIRPRNVVPVRHVCWRLFREFSGLSAPAIARVTGRGCHTTILAGIARCLRVNMNIPQWAAVYWATRTHLSAAGHVLVEDLSVVRRK